MGSGNGQKIITLTGSTDILDLLATMVLMFSSAIVPLIVILHKVDLDAQTAAVYSGASAYIDIFNYWKAQALFLCLALLLLFWMIRVLQLHAYPLKTIFAALAAYGLLAIFSTLLSQYPYIAARGFPDRSEGLYVILCYLMLTFTGAMVLRTERLRVAVITATLVSGVLLAILGAAQYLGADFFQTDAGKRLIVPESYAVYRGTLDFLFGANIMYATVFNPNYLGSYSALLFPVSVMLLFQWQSGKFWKRSLGMVFVAAIFVLWIGGMSRAGLLGGISSILLLIALSLETIHTYWKTSILVFVGCLGIFFLMNLFSKGACIQELRDTIPSSIASLFPANKVVEKQSNPDSQKPHTFAAEEPSVVLPPKPLVKNVTLIDNAFRFETETETLVVRYRNNAFEFTDDNAHPVVYSSTPTTATDGSITRVIAFFDPRYASYKLQMFNNGSVFQWYGGNIPLIIVDGKLTIHMKEDGFITTVDSPKTFGFKGNELFASSRGYIWSRSIPLMKDTILLGHGPDTYPAYFPQNEIAAKLNWLDSHNLIIDKPHNWYLQLGINTGVLSLLCVLLFLGWFIVKALIIMNKPGMESGRLLHVGILCGVVGYCIAAFFNDSNVSVSPVFWTILGVGLSYVVNLKSDAVRNPP